MISTQRLQADYPEHSAEGDGEIYWTVKNTFLEISSKSDLQRKERKLKTVAAITDLDKYAD